MQPQHIAFHDAIRRLEEKAEQVTFREQLLVTFRRMGHWEFAAAFVTTMYGLFLILPFQTLTLIGLHQERNIFLRNAAEAMWGIAFLVAGMNQWVGAWINYIGWRMINGVVIAAIWVSIAYLYFGIYPGSTAGFLAGVMAWCITCGLASLMKAFLAE